MGSDGGRNRSRSPIGATPGGCVTRTPTMSDVDENVFPDLVEEDLDYNNNASGVPKAGGRSPKGDTVGPASPPHMPMV